jgi:hypothetical protein
MTLVMAAKEKAACRSKQGEATGNSEFYLKVTLYAHDSRNISSSGYWQKLLKYAPKLNSASLLRHHKKSPPEKL